MTAPRLLIFIPSFGDGGVERMLVNLAGGFAALGVDIAFASKIEHGPYLDRLLPAVRRIVLASRNDRALTAELADSLRAERPAVLMSAKERDDRIALDASRSLGQAAPRCFLRVGTSIATRENARKSLRLKAWLHRRALRKLYARCDGLLANSEGVARELIDYVGVAPERVNVVPNPTVTPDLEILAQEPLEHDWFAPGQPPVILGIGRLSRAKDFPTLIQAFALLRARRPCRLAILGEGGQRQALENLARRLGVAEDVSLPGFVSNPFAWLKRASLFVLSSQREGCPNVLIEALALGTPVVATDCPSGPREILAGGEHAPLIPVGDPEAMSAAMAATLDAPPPAEFLREAVRSYTVENSARAYLRAFGLLEPTS